MTVEGRGEGGGRGIVLVNPHAGEDETPVLDIASSFPGSRITEITGKAVRAQVQDAIAGEAAPTFLAVAGGDGTMRCAAGVVAGSELALVPVPAGTRNHFAKEVGIETVADAAAAAADGRVTLVDIGDVNGEAFINNANIGVYPRILRERKVRERLLSKTAATVVATWIQVRRLRKFDVTVDGGRTYRAWMVFVGNGRYGSSLFDVGSRQCLDGGVLDVRILRADGWLARLRVVLALVAGRPERSAMAVFDEVSAVELGFRRDRIEVALDGELVAMDEPLRFRCRKGALRVLVPSG